MASFDSESHLIAIVCSWCVALASVLILTTTNLAVSFRFCVRYWRFHVNLVWFAVEYAKADTSIEALPWFPHDQLLDGAMLAYLLSSFSRFALCRLVAFLPRLAADQPRGLPAAHARCQEVSAV